MPALSKELTELVDIDPHRVDGVKTPASGFPFLVIKSVAKDVNPQGGVDETPDIAGAEQVLQLLAQLIEAEAREMCTGQWDEICDIQSLTEAAFLIKWFKHREERGSLEDDGEPIVKSVDEFVSVASYVLKRKISAAERKRLASEGHALPDGSYPIETAEDLHNAAVLARSGHGDVAAAKRLIAKRAKELGVPNPLGGSTSKDTVLPDNTPTAPATEDKPVEKSLDELVSEAVAKAMNAHNETVKGLRDEMAALKAQPIPGGPVITNATVVKSEDQHRDQVQLTRFEQLAKSVQDRELARYYADRAAELKARV